MLEENCIAKTTIAGIGGYVIGIGFGIFMAAIE